jgi:WD40 repeat protein
LLAAAARDGLIRVWNVADGSLRLIAGHPSPNPGMIFNIDGTRLLTWASDGARIWNTGNGNLIYARQFSGAASNSFDISSNGRWVMDSSSSRLAMQDTQSGAELFTLDAHRGTPRARDISEDDHLLATGGADGRVVLWEIPHIPTVEFQHAVDPLQWASAPWAPAVTAVYNHAGTVIATGAGDGFVKLWDAKSQQYLRGIKADSKAVNVVDFSPDDSRFLTGGEIDGVKLWDAASGDLRRTIDCDGKRVLTAAFSPDGHTIAVGVRGGMTYLWDADNGERLASFERDEPRSAHFDPAGKRFAIGVHGAAKLWDIEQKKFLWSTQLKNADKTSDDVAAIDFSPDGQRMLVAVRGENAYQLDARDGHMINQVAEPSVSPINVARFSNDGELAVLGAYSGVAMVWRPGNGQSRVMRGHAGEVRSAEFSPDSHFVLTSGVDGTAKIWDVSTGELLDTVAEHGSQMPQVPFQAASFSADGRWVLTGSVDGTIRLWGVREELRTPQQLESILRCRVPWRLDQENLLPANPEDSACPAYQ